jgi:hypothetical protein
VFTLLPLSRSSQNILVLFPFVSERTQDLTGRSFRGKVNLPTAFLIKRLFERSKRRGVLPKADEDKRFIPSVSTRYGQAEMDEGIAMRQ